MRDEKWQGLPRPEGFDCITYSVQLFVNVNSKSK